MKTSLSSSLHEETLYYGENLQYVTSNIFEPNQKLSHTGALFPPLFFLTEAQSEEEIEKLGP